jgi:hypothetical protein
VTDARERGWSLGRSLALSSFIFSARIAALVVTMAKCGGFSFESAIASLKLHQSSRMAHLS